jgi:hypothetical protein
MCSRASGVINVFKNLSIVNVLENYLLGKDLTLSPAKLPAALMSGTSSAMAIQVG